MLLVCWPRDVKPADVTVIDWVLECPVTNPTTRSFDAVGVAVPESAAVPVLEVPAAASTGLTAATPENSMTSMAIGAALLTFTVTVVAGAAFAAYQISPSEL